MASSEIAKRRAAAREDSSGAYLQRRQEIVHAAAEVFRRKGLANTNLVDVAQEAGVDRASIYYYVGSKKELFDLVVLDAFVANVEMAERIRDEEGDPVVKLATLVQRLIESYGEHYPHLYVFLQEDMAKLEATVRHADGVDVAKLYRRFEYALMAIIEEGMDNGTFRADIPPRIAAYGIIGMANWTHRWFDPGGPIGPREVGRAFALLATEGLERRTLSTQTLTK